MKITRFNLGRMIATTAVTRHEEVFKAVPGLLRRHRNCDYGDIPKEDVEANDDALKSLTNRVLSSYQVQAQKVFVITEGLGSKDLVTTVLFAKEY